MIKSSLLAAALFASLLGCTKAEEETAHVQQSTSQAERIGARLQQSFSEPPPANQPQQQPASPGQTLPIAQVEENEAALPQTFKERYNQGETETIYVLYRHKMVAFYARNVRTPESHEEFMEVIWPQVVETTIVPLPPLNPGETYWYDTEVIDEDTGRPGVLMIIRDPDQ